MLGTTAAGKPFMRGTVQSNFTKRDICAVIKFGEMLNALKGLDSDFVDCLRLTDKWYKKDALFDTR
jgi:hypothetical protein